MLLTRLIPIALLTLSSEVLCTSLHNWWVVPEEAGNVKEIKSSIRVPHGSDPEHTYWMANGFNQGLSTCSKSNEPSYSTSLFDRIHGHAAQLWH